MSTDRHESTPETAGALLAVASGIPAPLALGAFKGLSRLIGGLADYPAAWLRRASQGVEDGTNARSLFTHTMAVAAANAAANDPALVTRALQSIATGAVRKQLNREAIANEALEELKAIPTGEDAEAVKGDVPPPSDDWMNIFERYAEDASSERMQTLWAKVLAGEIRRPKSYSPATMRFLAEADQDLAEVVEKLGPFVLGDVIATTEEMNEGELLTALLTAESAGLISGVGGNLSNHHTIQATGHSAIFGARYALLVEGPEGTTKSFPIMKLTNVGRQVFGLTPPSDEEEILRSIADKLKGEPLTALTVCRRTGPNTVDKGEPYWTSEMVDAERKP